LPGAEALHARALGDVRERGPAALLELRGAHAQRDARLAGAGALDLDVEALVVVLVVVLVGHGETGRLVANGAL
jgi:hypothetical protein